MTVQEEARDQKWKVEKARKERKAEKRADLRIEKRFITSGMGFTGARLGLIEGGSHLQGGTK
jgi:hypothetical protein